MSTVSVDYAHEVIDEARRDAFPFGLVQLDHHGTVLHYSPCDPAQHAYSKVGLNFFHDMSADPTLESLENRFNELALTHGCQIEPHTFASRFVRGEQEVSITMVRRAGGDESIYVVLAAAPIAVRAGPR